jgi:hypothetical protein
VIDEAEVRKRSADETAVVAHRGRYPPSHSVPRISCDSARTLARPACDVPTAGTDRAASPGSPRASAIGPRTSGPVSVGSVLVGLALVSRSGTL